MDRGVLRRPSVADWVLTAKALAAFSLLAVPFGLFSGLFAFKLADDPAEIAKIALIIFFVPALFEEVLFRGPVVWLSFIGSRKLLYVAALSLGLFVLWHPLNGMFLMTEARGLFTDWRFLFLAALLGLVATHLAIKTRCIWPPVVFHWLVVVGWKVFLGGPQF